MFRIEPKGAESAMKRETIRKILFAVAGSVFLFSSAMVTTHQWEMRSSAEQAQTVAQMVVTPAPPPPVTPPTELPKEESMEAVVEEPTETAPIQVDFDALCASNPDVIAWIYCPDTPINYPVVQSSDNDYYLRRLLDGSWNTAGTLFMDYRNASNLTDWNSIIYGHNLKNSTMFGTLLHYQEQSYFEAHPKIYLLTPEQDYAIEVLAGYTTPADSALYSALAPNEEDQAQWVKNWLASSDFVSGAEPAAEARFVTLSTCSYAFDRARYVLIGSLKPLADQQE